MKKSELRNIIREEIKTIMETRMVHVEIKVGKNFYIKRVPWAMLRITKDTTKRHQIIRDYFKELGIDNIMDVKILSHV